MSAPFFLVGPTAVGKTELAVCLAERIGAEIVSADAFQVYAGFDRLTAKPTVEQRQRVAHHLVGSVPPAEVYSVARYLREAQSCLADIAARGKKALVVGGSGLYVKALTHGLVDLPEAQPKLRCELEALTQPELLTRLQALDPATAERIDAGNKRRLVRALEVCVVTGRPFSAFQAEWQDNPVSSMPTGVFLFRDRAELIERIERRTATLFTGAALDEVRRGAESSLSGTAARILGLAETLAVLAGNLDTETCRATVAVKTRQYAKRQMTWFKRETCFAALNLSALPAGRCLEALLNAVQAARTDWCR